MLFGGDPRIIALRDCAALRSTQFLGNVETIENDAFSDCPLLSEVAFQGTLGSLRYDVFRNCPALTSPEGQPVIDGFFLFCYNCV